MIIKVCGMREAANVREVEQLGADWMGFIFYPQSPRYVGEVLAYLPERMKRVGVFVNEDSDRLLALAEKNRLNILQLHGNESPDDCKALREKGFPVVKVFGVTTDKPFPWGLTEQYEGCCDYFLFDTRTNLYGGSGKKFGWEILSGYRGGTPFLLSGGVSPEDVEAVKRFSHPKCVGIDLNSGFETSPAVKNTQLLRRFISAFR
ncbi:phosphoribosylanthranilate isomerase [Proteiniphilum sp. X52]|uniref:phosphoribosylanthranilate isomerase n=1 Tax=Proteiniphilum sp. X52 TaxID=2382159 RepID=UPI000F0A4600|nr:phosphoribosylanthranilate isomerase [Proteiniphilum sp. X52]RNC66095.1 phosphoribosylanthranilate isomerase [Proteiniphilum sp. X52]